MDASGTSELLLGRYWATPQQEPGGNRTVKRVFLRPGLPACAPVTHQFASPRWAEETLRGADRAGAAVPASYQAEPGDPAVPSPTTCAWEMGICRRLSRGVVAMVEGCSQKQAVHHRANVCGR